MSWREYFPYEPRLDQQPIAEFVSKNIKEENVCIVEAPYGIGKSIAMLSAALASGKKIVFATCNNSAHNAIVDEVLRINNKFKKSFTVASIIAKGKLCLHDEFSYDTCDQLKKDDLCKYYSKMYDAKSKDRDPSIKAKKAIDEIGYTVKKKPYELLHHPFSQYVKSKSIEHGLCPYELMTQLAKKADVIILDYFYIFTDLFGFSKNKFGIDPKNSILFVDEADELKDRILNDLTKKISALGIQRLREQARKTPGMSDEDVQMLDDLLSIFNEMFEGKEGYFDLDKEKILHSFTEVFGDFDDFIVKLANIVGKVSSNFERVASRPDTFFEYLQEMPEDQFSYGYQSDTSKSMMISPYELYSAAVMYVEGTPLRVKDVLEEFSSSVLFSATIGNVEIFKRGIGLEFADFFSSNKFNTDNFKVVLRKDISSKYVTRKVTAPKIVEDVKFCSQMTKGVLLALPSQATSYDIVPHLNAKSLDVVKECKEGVYYAVLGGRSSRGINKAHNLGIVYVYGLQLPQKDDYLFCKRRDYLLKKYDRDIAYRFLYSNVVNKACQVAGRIFRRRHKKGMVVFADSRYKWDFMQGDFFYQCFPNYFKEKIHETSNLKEFQDVISSFWGKLSF